MEIVGDGSQQVLIILDSVLGLPISLNISFSQILERARSFSFEGKEFGAKVAFHFFQTFLASNGSRKILEFPHRHAEQITKANSVFRMHPYQRNIGCGTFRSLKDLAYDSRWFAVWPFESPDSFPILVAEGYPSYFWRTLLASKTRHLPTMSAYLKSHFPEADVPKGPNHADAIALVLGGKAALQSGYLENIDFPPAALIEGWIFGLPFGKAV